MTEEMIATGAHILSENLCDIAPMREHMFRIPASNAYDAMKALDPDVQALQARIDALMLEYCPDEMTREQLDEWARHQQPLSAADQAAADRALGDV